MTAKMIPAYALILTSLFALAANDYKSQAGQDTYCNEIFFNNKRNGVFIDIGAHDGISFSNSWYFEKTT